MKRLTLALLGIGTLIGLGFCFYQPTPRAVAPEAAMEGEPASEASAEETPPATATVEAVRAVPELRTPTPAPSTGPVTPSSPATNGTAEVAKPNLDSVFVSQKIDVLVSPQATYEQKQEAWKALREGGKLDQAIADLEQRVANHPPSADYPAALGRAYLQKCGTIQDVREQGILAMQADKVFDTALSIDSFNWEARFTKAVAMSYWPPVLNKGDEVIRHFQTLIEQQEGQTPQPQFAATYTWLGEQYQKAGRSEEAQAVWQRGAALFPTDEKLRTKLAPAQ